MSDHSTKVFEAVNVSSSHRLTKSNNLQRAFSILLFSVFVIVDLLALVAGTSSYGSLTRMQQTNDARLLAVGPVISSVRANDTQNGVQRSSDAPEGDALVLVQHDAEGTYETRIYLYEGKIVQEYTIAGSPYTPSKAVVLAESSKFEFSYEGDLLTIVTDAGETKIALRYNQGGA